MIILCGNRRIVTDRYGYAIQVRHVYEKGKKAGQEYWNEDRPAYPATLAQAFQMVFLRELQDGEDIKVEDLPVALHEAADRVNSYLEEFKKKGEKLDKARAK